jgi:16S rRNA C967 or C1407 C5-methylase (RsmB/RsmF family)
LQVQHGDNVLDLCAAPGGKSLALAQNLWVHLHGDDTALKHDTLHRRPLKIGTLHANEVDATRQRRLAENLQSYLPPGLFPSRHIAALRVDGTRPKSLYDLCVQTPSGTVAYDKVLVDAPCSSERHVIHAHAQASARGALAPEMGSWRAGTSKRLAAIQLQLLLAGLKAVRVGGTVMYATCSIEPTENDEVIAKMVKEVEKERKKGVRWRVAIGFEGGDGDASLEKELEEGWAERTKYGWIVLPDHPAGGAWGPLYFVVLTKLAG